ncbi:hypothetical protein N7450_007606 [Penicillium hetheringtonii]|uniref:Glutaredoxin domain-containing protein n=1 Tax=Penicillium hetheringtonii TaxID=911720 RepID=A0AAD6GSS7_9EURO|nr:hypothetical protein N7450_007606 [Penicillium hetheringtonii]
MSDSTLYLYTSLTAGSSHIVTATARVETILKANKLPFRAIDVATDEAARKLWGRRSKGKKLPGLVKYGDIVGDLEQIEEWNEFGELRMVVNSVQDLGGMPATSNPLPASTEPEPTTPKPSTIKIQSPPVARTEEKKDEMAVLALRQASQEAASQAKNKGDEKKTSQEESKSTTEGAAKSATPTKTHRGSVAPELPETAPDSPKGLKRPTMVVPEAAAVSSANFHVGNAEMLGLVEHHRGSIIPSTNSAGQDPVKRQSDEPIVEEATQSAVEEPKENVDGSAKEKEDNTEDNKEEAKKEEEKKEEEKSAEPKTEVGSGESTVSAEK